MKSKKKMMPSSLLEGEQAKLEAAEEEKRRRYFMGRLDFFLDFEMMIAKPLEERKAWCIYGVGAIGKSWLLAELDDRSKSAGLVTSRVNLEGISDPEDFFAALWEGLPEQSRIFFGKTKKKVKNLEKSRNARLESDEKALAKIAKGVLYGAFKAGVRVTDIAVPGAGSAAELAVDGAMFLAEELRKETDMEAERLNKEMIEALFADIEVGLKKNEFKTAIFLDTFERCSPSIAPSVFALLEFLSHSAQIVVAGRESLLEFHLPQDKGWDEIIEEKKLAELKKEEIREWLEPGADSSRAADTKAGIIERISNGFPLLVTFVLETVGDTGIEELVSADTADVEKEQQEFFKEQIIKVLERLDEETARSLWLAAFPRRFDGTLFARYWKLYQEGISSGDVLKRFQRVQKYSFVHSEGGWLRCHPIIQSAVRRYLFENQKDLWRSLNEVSLKYFSENEGLRPFGETFFHQYQLQPVKSYEKFIETHKQLARDSKMWRLADILLEDFSSYCVGTPLDARAEEIFDIYSGVDSLLFEYPRGDRSTLCLRRISILKIAEGIVSSPELIADIQNSLGTAWAQLPTGDRAENIERAIGHYDKALQVHIREAFPTNWAMTHNNLGIAFGKRIKGERAENIETAIGHFDDALEVFTHEAFPTEWAMAHNNLGNAYRNRIKGERAENIETAIGHYDKALQVRTREAFPTQRASTHNNLGNAYSERIKGEHAENIEMAIGHYDDALEVYTREAFPTGWATTHNNLGIAFGKRIKGERAENIERAIGYYDDALQVRTREAFPTDWATTHNNLGEAFRNRIKGERAENIERAIGHFDDALQVRTREAFPTDWAMTNNNLGLAYNDRIKGERAVNIEKAIGHYDDALGVYTREAFPTEFGVTKFNLALVFLENDHPLPENDRLGIALKHLNEACDVLSPEFPPHRVAFDLRDRLVNRLSEIG